MSKNTAFPIKRALLSVFDKTGIVEFARQLHLNGIEILSTGGTAKLLQKEKIPVIEVSSVTGFPEIMDGRVKTLHPKIHGAILARRDQDQTVLDEHDITPIDLLVVNLYPFEQATQQADCDLPTAIENIDIGGPTMLRAAAKNHAWVTVVVNPVDYTVVLNEITAHQGTVSEQTRFRLAQTAFAHTAH